MKALIVGAGNIGLGFLGHLLWKSGQFSVSFMETRADRVDVLNREHGFLDALNVDSDALNDELTHVTGLYAALVQKHHGDYGATKIMKKHGFDTAFCKAVEQDKGPSSFAHGLVHAASRIGTLPRMIKYVGRYF